MIREFECVVGAWLSLVERLVRDQEVGGSNPLAPTIYTRLSANNGGIRPNPSPNHEHNTFTLSL